MNQDSVMSIEIDGTRYLVPIFYADNGESLTDKITRLVQEDGKSTEIS